MSERADARDHLPLTNLAFHLLLSLGDGPAHGYSIGQEVERRSEGMLSPATGSLYQALKRLSEDGLVEKAPAEGGDARRQYYRLTGLGRAVAEAEAHRLSRLVGVARSKRLFSGR